MNFKQSVMRYLNTKAIKEEEDDEVEESSVKTCPECGKKKCECGTSKCKSSMRTGTHGEEDDDGWHMSCKTPSVQTGTKGADDDDDLKSVKACKDCEEGLKGETTPEEEELLAWAKEMLKTKKADFEKFKAKKTNPSCKSKFNY